MWIGHLEVRKMRTFATILTLKTTTNKKSQFITNLLSVYKKLIICPFVKLFRLKFAFCELLSTIEPALVPGVIVLIGWMVRRMNGTSDEWYVR
jgi:hypothetical protein